MRGVSVACIITFEPVTGSKSTPLGNKMIEARIPVKQHQNVMEQGDCPENVGIVCMALSPNDHRGGREQ